MNIDTHANQIKLASQCLKALAHPGRLAILCALREGEKTVQTLEKALGSSQSGMSMQLSTLRERGVLATRRQGTQIFYRVADERLFELLQVLQRIFCPDETDKD